MSPPYRPVTIDDSAQLLDLSYRLRYQSFCLERLFFSKDQFPAQLESDAFDRTSVHVGVLNAHDELVGTARVVRPNSAGLPLLRYCTLFPHETTLADPSNTVVELSRVCVNRRSNRATDKAGVSPEERAFLRLPSSAHEPGRESTDAFATLIKAMYQATKRMRGTHWIIAVEKALRRRIARYGLPFRPAGPEADYHGPVVPYVMNLAELDGIIRSGTYPVLNDFPVGLEPEYWPSALGPGRTRLEARVS
jgi:N-acyl amino acid synthase of PEP-CTERM/exosortase system